MTLTVSNLLKVAGFLPEEIEQALHERSEMTRNHVSAADLSGGDINASYIYGWQHGQAALLLTLLNHLDKGKPHDRSR